MYFRKRIPRNVTLDYNGLATRPRTGQHQCALFEWVVENLMKNSLDALQGHGTIDVRISSTTKHVMIDVKDTGKGSPKSNWKRILRARIHHQNPRLGTRTVALETYRRGVSPG